MESKLDNSPYIETSPHRAKSFKAVIVLTKHDGIEPTVRDVHQALESAGLTFALPANQDGTIVISFSVEKKENLHA